jgi:hypothetical protein
MKKVERERGKWIREWVKGKEPALWLSLVAGLRPATDCALLLVVDVRRWGSLPFLLEEFSEERMVELVTSASGASE